MQAPGKGLRQGQVFAAVFVSWCVALVILYKEFTDQPFLAYQGRAGRELVVELRNYGKFIAAVEGRCGCITTKVECEKRVRRRREL
jgi:hypothetical protein